MDENEVSIPTPEQLAAALEAERDALADVVDEAARIAAAIEVERDAYAAWIAEQDELMGIGQEVPEPPPEDDPADFVPVPRAPREKVARRFETYGELGDAVVDIDALIREEDARATRSEAELSVDIPPRIPLPPSSERPDWSQLQNTPVLSALSLPADAYPDNFFGFYDVYARRALSTRPEYNWATACALIGSVLGRDWQLETVGGSHNLSANLFVALVGGSGTRKSLTAQAMQSCAPTHLWTAINPRSDIGFLEALAARPHMIWFLDEAGSLFKKLYSKNFEQMIPALTSIYDGQTTTVKAKSYETTVETPSVTLVCCTIEDGLIPPGDRAQVRELFTSGLLSRFLLCAADEEPGDPLLSPLDENAAATLANWLMKRRLISANRPATLRLSSAAWSQLRWYLESRGRSPVGLMSGAWKRAVTWAQKLALIYHVAEGRWPNQEISPESLLQALRAVHHYVLPAHLYVARKALYNNVQILLDEVVTVLERSPQGLSLTDLATLVGRDERARYSALALLNDQLRWSSWTGPRGGRPSTVMSLRDPDGDDADLEVLQRERAALGFTPRYLDLRPPAGVAKVLVEMEVDSVWGDGPN